MDDDAVLSPRVFGRPFDMEEIEAAAGEKGHAHFQRILQSWADIVDGLQLFSSYKLAAGQVPKSGS